MNRKTPKTNKKETKTKDENFLGEGTYGSVVIEIILLLKNFGICQD